jgi:hypothetical protein
MQSHRVISDFGCRDTGSFPQDSLGEQPHAGGERAVSLGASLALRSFCGRAVAASFVFIDQKGQFTTQLP